MTDPDPATLRSRTIGTVCADSSDAEISVEHVYFPEGELHCDGCGSGHDPGMIGLITDGGEENHSSVLMTAEEALVLANRIQRAVSLVLESQEDGPDLEREAAKFTGADER